LEEAVSSNSRRDIGAWFALSDVMWERNKKQNLVVA
jgi:hypothetical protein